MSIEAGTYRGHRAYRWTDDMAQTTDGDKPILRVSFDLHGEEIEWTCWMDDMQNAKGEPSANLRGLQALGVQPQDLENWMRGGALLGLDRNEVDLVVERNRNDYLVVKYVNDPNAKGVRQSRPLDRNQRVNVGRAMLESLRALTGAAAQAQPAAQARPALPTQQQRPAAGWETAPGGPAAPRPAQQRRAAAAPPLDDFEPPLRHDDDLPF